MLGYSGAVSAPGRAYFGRGAGRIWLDEVGCSGRENSLFDCNHSPWGDHDCSHSEDAGVVCGGEHVQKLLCDAFNSSTLLLEGWYLICWNIHILLCKGNSWRLRIFYQVVNEN